MTTSALLLVLLLSLCLTLGGAEALWRHIFPHKTSLSENPLMTLEENATISDRLPGTAMRIDGHPVRVRVLEVPTAGTRYIQIFTGLRASKRGVGSPYASGALIPYRRFLAMIRDGRVVRTGSFGEVEV